MLSLWISLAFAETPIQINVTDRNVSEVFLVCGDRTVSARVVENVATFAEHLNNCKVEFRSSVGLLKSPGVYTCSANNGCQEKGVVHKQVSNIEGRVNIILTDQSADMFELRCGSSYRQRVRVETNTATFEGVPSGGCTLHFKGYAPAKTAGIEPGTYQCSAIGGVGKCRRR